MPSRALIIAIEEYPSVQGFAPTLKGTMDAAVKFRKWLIAERRVPEANIRFCAHPLHADASTGAKRADIIEEIKRLYDDGYEKTDTLFIYFSGHGFTYSDVDDRRTDALVCSDFTKPGDSGGSCINLDELRERLWVWLGPGEHFYFIDACRNLLRREDIQVLGLGITRPRSPRAVPARHSLQSTVQGAMAGAGSQFPVHLLAGLRGEGRAKSWDHAPPGAMAVHFGSLTEYLLAKMPEQPVDPDPDGKSPGVLKIIQPAPKTKCTITIEGLAANQKAALQIINRQNQPIWNKEVSNGETPVELAPEDYYISVDAGTGTVTPSGLVKLDMYEPTPLKFEVTRTVKATRAPAGVTPSKVPEGALRVQLPFGTELHLRDATTGMALPQARSGDETLVLPAGRYEAVLDDREGVMLDKRTLNIEAGGEQTLNMTVFKRGRLRDQLLRAVPGGHQDGVVFFSEQLGPLADQDLGLWLAIVGASRILGGEGAFSKLGPLPLAEFKHVKPGGSAIYVLAGFDEPRINLEVGVSRGRTVARRKLVAVEQIGGLQELALDSDVGPQLVSWRIDQAAPVTIASVTLPNRATLVTLTKGDDGRVQAGQFLLPLPHLLRHLAPKVRQRIEYRHHLRDVKFLYRAWRAFRDRRDVFAGPGHHALVEILYDKWIDPVGALLASYELIRRGRRDELHEVVENLNRFFPELPDTAAITRLVVGAAPSPHGAPLFLEGAMAFDDHPEIFPLPVSMLDYGMTWTAWRGAV